MHPTHQLCNGHANIASDMPSLPFFITNFLSPPISISLSVYICIQNIHCIVYTYYLQIAKVSLNNQPSNHHINITYLHIPQYFFLNAGEQSDSIASFMSMAWVTNTCVDNFYLLCNAVGVRNGSVDFVVSICYSSVFNDVTRMQDVCRTVTHLFISVLCGICRNAIASASAVRIWIQCIKSLISSRMLSVE